MMKPDPLRGGTADQIRMKDILEDPEMRPIAEMFRNYFKAHNEMVAQPPRAHIPAATPPGAPPRKARSKRAAPATVDRALVTATLGGVVPDAMAERWFEEQSQALDDDVIEALEKMLSAQLLVTSSQLLRIDAYLSGAAQLVDVDRLTQIKARLNKELARTIGIIKSLQERCEPAPPSQQVVVANHGNLITAQINTVEVGEFELGGKARDAHRA